MIDTVHLPRKLPEAEADQIGLRRDLADPCEQPQIVNADTWDEDVLAPFVAAELYYHEVRRARKPRAADPVDEDARAGVHTRSHCSVLSAKGAHEVGRIGGRRVP